MDFLQNIVDMFVHGAAIYAALQVLYVASVCGAIFLVCKAFSR